MPQNEILNRNNIIKLLAAWIVFFAPLKFGLPLVQNIPNFWPQGFWEWLLWSWPAEVFCVLVMVLGLLSLGPILSCIKTHSSLWIVLAVIIVLGGISTCGSVARSASIGQGLLFGAYIIVWVWMVVYYTKEEDHFFIAEVITMTTLIVAVYGLYQHVQGFEATRQLLIEYDQADISGAVMSKLGQGRVFSTFIYPNVLAGYLAITFPFILSMMLRVTHLKRRLLYGAIAIISMATLWFTGSRSGGIVFACVSFLYLFGFIPRKIRIPVFVVGTLGFLLIGAYVVGMMLVPSSLTARLDYWTSALNIFRDHPWWGIGPGAFGYVYPQYMIAGAEETKMVHNNFLQILVEWGGLSGLAWAVFAYLGLRRWKLDSTNLWSYSAGISLIGFGIYSLVDFGLYVPGLGLIAFVMHGILCSGPKAQGGKIKSWQKTFVLVILTVLGILSVWWITNYIKTEYKIDESRHALKEKNILKAVRLLEEAVGGRAGIPFAAQFLGQVYANRGQWTQAHKAYAEAIKLAPTYHQFYADLARLEWRRKDKGQTSDSDKDEIYWMNKAIRYYPTLSLYHAELAVYYREHFEFEQAQKSLNEALLYYQKTRNKDPRVLEIINRIKL